MKEISPKTEKTPYYKYSYGKFILEGYIENETHPKTIK